VHRRRREQEGGQRVVEIALEMARCCDVGHQEDAVRPERVADASEHATRCRLVVNRVERRDEVEGGRSAEGRRVLNEERGVREPVPLRLGAGRGNRVGGDVETDEAAAREVSPDVDGGSPAIVSNRRVR
jgi:hypothetical protein